MATLDASLCEVFQGWEIASSLKPPHTHWCHDFNEGNERDSSCITDDDPEMSQLATPVIFGCLVMFYIGHLTVLMTNLADGGIDGLRKCSECAMNAGAKDADMRCHECMGNGSETGEDDENEYCNDSSYNSDSYYFEYSHNETGNNERSFGANTEDFFDVSDDDYFSVYYDDSMSNEIINTDDEGSVEEGSGDEKSTVSDGDCDSYDTLNNECDDDNCYDSSDKDSNSWQ